MTEHRQKSPSSIGQRLRELRQRRGLSQQDLVTPDISASYISLIETGKRVPSEGVLAGLAERVGTSVEYLRTGRSDHKVKELQLKIATGDMALRNGAYGEALQAYGTVLSEAPLLDAPSLRRARVGQALAMEKLGRLEPAIELLSTLFDDALTVAGSAEWTRLATALCRSYRDAGDLVLSVEIGEQTLRKLDGLGLEATDDYLQLGAVLVDCYRIRGDLTRAHLLADRLVRNEEVEPCAPVARGAVYWNAALVAQARHRPEEALTLAERALALLAETDNDRHKALLKEVCGELLLDADATVQRAAEMIEQAQGVLIAVGSPVEQAKGEIGLAKARLRLGDAQQAVEHASRALGLLSSRPLHQAAEARAVLAQAQFARGEGASAVQTLLTAERQLVALPPSRVSAEVWRRIGDLWHTQSRQPDAIRAYQRALTEIGVPAAVDIAVPGARQHD